MTPDASERRAGNREILAELQRLGGKIEDNTSATRELSVRVKVVEDDVSEVQAFNSELKGGVKTGRWIFGILITLGLGVAGLLNIPE